MLINGYYLYRKGTMRLSSVYVPGRPVEGERGNIRELSSKSRQRMAMVAQECDVNWNSMLTLTYPGERYNVWGKEVKENLREMLSYLDKAYFFSYYFWFIEFQRMGMPHFHILSSVDPSNVGRVALFSRWAEISTETLVQKNNSLYVHLLKDDAAWSRLRDADAAKKYVMKYATKTNQKKVPPQFEKVGRFWGCNQRVMKTIPKPRFVACNEAQLRYLLVTENNDVGQWDKLPMIIFNRTNVSRETFSPDKVPYEDLSAEI